jgi:prepilin peptidase CpaA
MNAIELLLILLVAQAAVTDLAVRKIPNVLVLGGLLLALALHLLAEPRWGAAGFWLAGLLAGFFLFLPLYAARGMAAGDVKLMAMVGAFAGPGGALRIAVLTWLAGGLMALAMLAATGRWRQGMRNLRVLCRPLWWRLLGVPLAPAALAQGDSAGNMPYGLAIAAGTFLELAWRHA